MRATTIALLLSFAVASPLAPAAESTPAETTPVPTPTPGDPHAGPAAGEPARIQPGLMTVNAGEGGTYSISDAVPSKLRGGVEIGYENARIFCDHVDYWQSPLVGVRRSALDRAFFLNGEHAREPEHVIFDTRKCELPTIAFRGLMTPTDVEVRRQPFDEEQPKLAHFLVKMHHLGDFAGEMQTSNGWAPYAGWAEEAEILMATDVVEAGLIKPRFEYVVLHGRPAAGPEEKRGAIIERLSQPIPPGTAAKMLHTKAMDWSVKSRELTIFFDEEGRMKEYSGQSDLLMMGSPSLDLPAGHQSPPAQPTKR